VAELLVLQHHPDTGPSGFAEVLTARTSIAPSRTVQVAAGEALPPGPGDLAGVLVMGGPMSVTRPGELPWLAAELAFLRGAVDAGVPVLGVCLGAQLLGTALGGAVAARQVPAARFAPLRRTAGGAGEPVTAGWPDGATALLLHEDEVVTFPDEAVPLLHGPDDDVVAWSLGSAVAIQAHPEVTADQLTTWLAHPDLEDLVARSGVDASELAAEGERRERFTLPLGRAFVGRWLDGPVRRRVEALAAA
jgi:GMP synthase (glutamine-hydrolysing)